MRKKYVSKKKSQDVEIQYHRDPSPKTLLTKERVVFDEQFLDGDRVQTRRVIKEVDPRDNFKDYRVSDFYIENMEAVGALANAKVVQYGDIDVDSVSAVLDALDAQQTQQQTQQTQQ